MNTNNKLTTQTQESTPESWGNRQEIAAIARRLKTMLPNGGRLTDDQAFAAAQYAQLSHLDPFSGGFYAMPGGGIINHYAVIVGWAQDKAPYSDKYMPLTDEERTAEGIADDVVAAWKCYILRDDRAHLLGDLLRSGMSFVEALDFFAAKGIGVVTKADTVGQNGQPIAPPKNWTWEKVAQKRALRAALSLSHGKPSAAELRAIAERVYQNSPDARLGRIEMQAAQIEAGSANMTPAEHATRLQQNAALLRGDQDDSIGEDWHPAEVVEAESGEENYYSNGS